MNHLKCSVAFVIRWAALILFFGFAATIGGITIAMNAFMAWTNPLGYFVVFVCVIAAIGVVLGVFKLVDWAFDTKCDL